MAHPPGPIRQLFPFQFLIAFLDFFYPSRIYVLSLLTYFFPSVLTLGSMWVEVVVVGVRVQGASSIIRFQYFLFWAFLLFLFYFQGKWLVYRIGKLCSSSQSQIYSAVVPTSSFFFLFPSEPTLLKCRNKEKAPCFSFLCLSCKTNEHRTTGLLTSTGGRRAAVHTSKLLSYHINEL